MNREELLDEVLEDVREDILACAVMKEGKSTCKEKRCDSYPICKEVFEHEELENET